VPKQSLSNISVKGERVLVRVDFNVPLDNGRVTDDTRIRAALPTITHLLESGNAVLLMSHLGRPKGKVVPELSLAPVSKRLGELLGKSVGFVDNVVGEVVETRARALMPGEVLLLENLRFHSEETANDLGFARQLAGLADRTFVNDAFGTAHRAHASTVGVTQFVDRAVAGLLMARELEYLLGLMETPARPYAAVLGGAKVSGKLEVIESLLRRVERLMIGGAMMFTFLKAQGRQVGQSLVEDDLVETAERVLEQARTRGVDFLLPSDCRVAASIAGTDPGEIVSVEAIPEDRMGVDIGPATAQAYRDALTGCGTVVWNGPMGVFEVEAYRAGTQAVAQALAALTGAGATTVVGGGDSAAAVKQLGLADQISHVSTGGGATLELLEGRELPAVVALSELRP
jgi:phosphoglycerate kinase